MREFKYDVIQLIQGVRDRPCLWDKTIENYKDRVERRHAWEEIFNTLEDKYDEMTPEEKRITGEHILNKWTNIRDTFVKTLKTKMGRPKRKYLLYDHLKFLTKIIPESDRNTDYSTEEYHNEEPSEYMKQESEPETSFTITTAAEPETNFTITNNVKQDTNLAISNVTSYGTKKRSKRNEFDDSQSTSYTMSEVSYASQKRKSKRFIFTDDTNETYLGKKRSKKGSVKGITEEQTSEPMNDRWTDIDFVQVDDDDPRIMNEDEAFFASLLPTVVKYNEDERLEFRIEVLGVMKQIKDKRKWAGE